MDDSDPIIQRLKPVFSCKKKQNTRPFQSISIHRFPFQANCLARAQMFYHLQKTIDPIRKNT